MPPRRSCFRPSGPRIRADLSGFNATTAFLLREGSLLPPVLQPGFNATTAFLLPGGAAARDAGWAQFQCHHGVPASRPSLFGRRHMALVSMPPRRSCFSAPIAGKRFPKRVSMPPRRSCFPIWPGGGGAWGTVSMPPRRSCFGADIDEATILDAVSMPPRRSCFPVGWWWRSGAIGVSMPPRRSCFRIRLHPPGLTAVSFNATTAFLLRGLGAAGSAPGPGFNATTAFLLPADPATRLPSL